MHPYMRLDLQGKTTSVISYSDQVIGKVELQLSARAHTHTHTYTLW